MLKKEKEAPINKTDNQSFWKKMSIGLFGALVFCILGWCSTAVSVGKSLPDSIIKATIGNFVMNIRSICSDPVILRSNRESAYAHTTVRGGRELSKMYKSINSLEMLDQRKKVMVEITGIEQRRKSVYDIYWMEYDFWENRLVSTKSYQGSVGFCLVDGGEMEKAYPINPTGIYIDKFTVSESRP